MTQWEDSKRISNLVDALLAKNSGLTYGEALRTVLNENKDKPFVRRYLGQEPVYISPSGADTNPKPKGPGIKKGKEETSKVQYVVGHPDHPDPHGRTGIGKDPRKTITHQGEMKMEFFEAGKEIDTLTQQYIFDHPEADYDKAMEAVLSMNPELKEAYAKS